MSTVEVPKVQLQDLEGLVGTTFGPSEWLTVDQDRINKFARATGDDQWIHVDPVRAKAEGPFGGTIFHGYGTLSLIPKLLWQLFEVEGAVNIINIGIDKLRFTDIVPVDSRVRLNVTIVLVKPNARGFTDVTLAVVVDIEDGKRPAFVADIVYRYYA